MSSWEELADVLYGGIKPDIPGHGGEECASYLPKSTMLLETAITTAMMLVVAVLGWWTYTMPSKFPVRDDHLGKRFLLAALCLVFGLEVGYKVCSRQVLYLLNPCHVITMIEVCCTRPRLQTQRSYGGTSLFRFTCWQPSLAESPSQC